MEDTPKKRIVRIKKKEEVPTVEDSEKKDVEAAPVEKKKRAPRKKKDATEDKPQNELIKAAEKPEDKEEDECCPICIDKYTSFYRRKITCSYCNEDMCMSCVKKYIVSTPDDPHCAHCRKGWPTSFLYEKLTRAYMIGDYANHRAAILWSRQESLLPTAQIEAERVIRGRKMREESTTTGVSKQITDLYAQIEKLTREKNVAEQDIHRLLNGEASLSDIRAAGGNSAEFEKKVRAEAREFVRRCPHTDCTGFLSSAWKCGICSNYSCNECLEVKGKERDAAHTCNADSLATAKLIAKDTKPCPKCGIYINKGVGCDLMWCTSCQTPFSWSTMKIVESRNIHNPHYFEFLQRTNGSVPRTPGDLICGGIPQPYYLVRNILITRYKTLISNILRQLMHVQDVELRRYHGQMTPNEHELKFMRIRVLLKEETKDSIQHKLQLYERQRERAHAIHAILETLVAVGGDLARPMEQRMNQITNNYKEQQEYFAGIEKQFEELRIYINAELMKVSGAYYCSVPSISNDWAYLTSTRKPTEPRKKQDTPVEAPKDELTPEKIRDLSSKESNEIHTYISDINRETNKDVKPERIFAFFNYLLTCKYSFVTTSAVTTTINAQKQTIITNMLSYINSIDNAYTKKDELIELYNKCTEHIHRVAPDNPDNQPIINVYIGNINTANNIKTKIVNLKVLIEYLIRCKLIYSVNNKFKEGVIEQLTSFKNDERLEHIKPTIEKAIEHITNNVQLRELMPTAGRVPLPSIPSLPAPQVPVKITSPVIPRPTTESEEERQLNQAIEESLKK